MHKHYGHTTSQEIRFINNLGKYREQQRNPKSRVDLLPGYLKGCCQRSDWGCVDKLMVMQHAADQLFREQKR